VGPGPDALNHQSEVVMLRRDLHQENRLAWNAATAAHNSHKRDQAAFLRAGGSTLFPEEIALLGDLVGLTLVHLQCNAGQDTLSLAQRGAVVTGVDISDTAIAFARQLAQDSGIPGTFVQWDVYDWFAQAVRQGEHFDVAFCSYGALCWLTDITLWAQGIADILVPGGRFVTVEFHPFAMVFDWHWKPAYPYFGEGQAMTWDEGVGDYVAMSGEALAPSGYMPGVQGFVNPHRSHECEWGIAEVVTALLKAGLVLTALEEYPYSNGAKLFEGMREIPGHRMLPPEGVPSLPLMYGLVAQKLR
jgi:SAM-dependent methyltransferase